MDLQARINGCWLGKAIGGTLGAPHEGKPGPLHLEFYDPVPTGVLPNDDLDLQIVWLHHLLERKASEVTPALLIEGWQKYVGFPFDEYGICLRNAAYGLSNEQVGSFDNWFSECMGAAIRSELWACIAPGDPARAAGFAWCDAVCDHTGDGVWAEIFFAALESAAFIEKDRDRLIDLGLDFLPSESRVKRAIIDTRRWWAKKPDWLSVRNQIHESYGQDNFTDVAANLAYTILGWLAGEGDFGRSILLANNCGADTDCTAATLGSILGIIDPGSIPQKWKNPVGEEIVLSPQITGFLPPPTVGHLTSRTLELRELLRDFTPQIGAVGRREPAGLDQSPIRIQAEVGSTRDQNIFKSLTTPSQGNSTKQLLPGHWIQRTADQFTGPVMLLRFQLKLEKEQTLRVEAWSQIETACWINGRQPVAAPLDPAGSYCKLNAPSFHRGGRGHADVVEPLEAGEHEFIIAWAAPSSGENADLVFGVADLASKQWLPFALAGLVQ